MHISNYWIYSLIHDMVLAYELGRDDKLVLACELVQHGKQVCEQVLDGKQGLVCMQELGGKEQVCGLVQDWHILRKIRQQCIHYSDQQCILHFGVFHQEEGHCILHSRYRKHLSLRLLQNWFQHIRH